MRLIDAHYLLAEGYPMQDNEKIGAGTCGVKVEKPHVVVIGGGFGGLAATRALKRAPVRVTLIDRENHHLFQPLLYQIATASLAASDIATPIRSVLSKQSNASVLLANVVGIDLQAKRVLLEHDDLPEIESALQRGQHIEGCNYDFLILAAGAESSYFGHDDWERRAPSLKRLDDALEIRKRILFAFEEAERERDAELRRRLLNFVVIGGGPTGVELAGALSELARRVLAHDFRRIDPRSAKVTLIEAGPRILSAFPEELSAKAAAQLNALGVQIVTGARVIGVDDLGVSLRDGGRLISATVIWAAGVRPSPLLDTLGVGRDACGRVLVEPDLSISGHPEVFAIGDVANVKQDGAPLPGLSPVAMQEGRAAARAITRTLANEPRTPFRYFDKGTMATIGRSRAVADVRGLRLSGSLAWMAWVVVHIWYLIGFRNRLVVMMNWAWSYLTFKRGARLITGLRHHAPLRPQPALQPARSATTSTTPETTSAIRS